MNYFEKLEVESLLVCSIALFYFVFPFLFFFLFFSLFFGYYIINPLKKTMRLMHPQNLGTKEKNRRQKSSYKSSKVKIK